MSTEILDNRQMQAADALTIRRGTSGYTLMCAAGQRISDVVLRLSLMDRRLLILAGPGNNGGDALVLARLLADHPQDFTLDLRLLSDPAGFSGDAAEALRHLPPSVVVNTMDDPALWHPAILGQYDLVVDGLFGTGLDRPLDAQLQQKIHLLNRAGVRTLSIDLPSGINGNTGRIMGAAIQARYTVTFFRLKQAHVLYPGRARCGEIHVGDIGIDAGVLDDLAPSAHENHPDQWSWRFGIGDAQVHKYRRGHALVISGGRTTGGAARLAATAALRSGCGVVSIGCPADAASINAGHLNDIMLQTIDSAEELKIRLADNRLRSVCIGPGLGHDKRAEDLLQCTIEHAPVAILDADALTLFADRPGQLFELIHDSGCQVVMTPHAGEFQRLFGQSVNDVDPDDKIALTRHAATVSGAVVVYKGPDTVIADPDGNVRINVHATRWLAVAGAGDILAGTICALAGAGWEPERDNSLLEPDRSYKAGSPTVAFDAACAGVWIHGEAGLRCGQGLIAGDLPRQYPAVLRRLSVNRPGFPPSGACLRIIPANP